MITDIPLLPGAKSLCWQCLHYEWVILLGPKNKIEHVCAENLSAGDDVQTCIKFKGSQ